MNINLPPQYTSFASAMVSLFGSSVSLVHTDRVSGGDINKSYALTLNNGSRIFMKANEKDNIDFFTAEAAGLSAIASTGAVRTPKILCTGCDKGEDVGYSFLLLEYIQSTEKVSGYWELFARELAAMHDAPTQHFTPQEKPFGFFSDNYIGRTAQKNSVHTSWIEFFRDERLVPQFKKADSYFTQNERKSITRLLDHLDEFLLEPEKPSLLHGDLWGGNVLCSDEGKAMLIDPACYVGNAEADIAMTELFGGFSAAFYSAYKEARPMQQGYEDRRDLYNLYHILNHLNMFGASYLEAAKSIIAEYVG